MRTPRNTLLLEIAYDGGAFHGIAPQPNLRTVAGELELALEQHWGVPMQQPSFSARTDAGVSARQNFVSVAFHAHDVSAARIAALRHLSIAGLRVVDAKRVERHMNARNLAQAKHYRYWLRDGFAALPAPEGDAAYCHARPWQLAAELDDEKMRRAAQCLLGEHDFSAFRSAGCGAKNRVKHITCLDVRRDAGHLIVDVRGNAFLRRMVRILVGTLVEVGTNERSVESVAAALKSKDRQLAGITAPALGLELVSVSLDLEPALADDLV